MYSRINVLIWPIATIDVPSPQVLPQDTASRMAFGFGVWDVIMLTNVIVATVGNIHEEGKGVGKTRRPLTGQVPLWTIAPPYSVGAD